MTNILRQLYSHPERKSVCWGGCGAIGFSKNGPLYSMDYNEQTPSCTAIAMLSREGLAGLSHTDPYVPISRDAHSMYDRFEKEGGHLGRVSAIISGTNERQIEGAVKYFEETEVRCLGLLLRNPNPLGVIDMGIDLNRGKFLLHRTYSGENYEVDFW